MKLQLLMQIASDRSSLAHPPPTSLAHVIPDRPAHPSCSFSHKPHRDVRKHRKVSHHDECYVCGAPDSWRHSLLECTMARCVWVLVYHDLLEHMIATREPSARTWLFSMIEVLKHDELVRMCATLWAICHARRKLIHEGITQSPYDTHMFVTNFISELDQLNEVTGTHTISGARLVR